jgi:hypothetical protein
VPPRRRQLQLPLARRPEAAARQRCQEEVQQCQQVEPGRQRDTHHGQNGE